MSQMSCSNQWLVISSKHVLCSKIKRSLGQWLSDKVTYGAVLEKFTGFAVRWTHLPSLVAVWSHAKTILTGFTVWWMCFVFSCCCWDNINVSAISADSSIGHRKWPIRRPRQWQWGCFNFNFKFSYWTLKGLPSQMIHKWVSNPYPEQ